MNKYKYVIKNKMVQVIGYEDSIASVYKGIHIKITKNGLPTY